jgi:hypothetical protein
MSAACPKVGYIARLSQWGGGGLFPRSNDFYLPSLRIEEWVGGWPWGFDAVVKGGGDVTWYDPFLQTKIHRESELPPRNSLLHNRQGSKGKSFAFQPETLFCVL